MSSQRYLFLPQRPLHAPKLRLDPLLPLTAGLALLSWGFGEAQALTCNRVTCRGNDAHTTAARLAPGSTRVLAWAVFQGQKHQRRRRVHRPQSAPQRRPPREYNNSLAALAGVELGVCGVWGAGQQGGRGVEKMKSQCLPQPAN